jgi:plastocyanin
MTKLSVVIILAALGVAGPAVAAKQKVQTRTLSADPGGGLSFTKTKLSARHGKVKLVMANPKRSGLPHGIAIAGHGKGKQVQPGKTSTVTAKLAKGTYTFFCPVLGHRAAGMKGKLLVK